MPRYVALLRAINVGGHVVKMDRLRALFAELGFTSVETFIASGNVVFESTERDAHALEERIAGHLRESLGYAVATFVRTPGELAEVAAAQPFPPADVAGPGHRLYVAFLGGPLGDDARGRVLALRSASDDFHVVGREVYWLCRVPINESPVAGPKLERALGSPATVRNVTTVTKLAAKYHLP